MTLAEEVVAEASSCTNSSSSSGLSWFLSVVYRSLMMFAAGSFLAKQAYVFLSLRDMLADILCMKQSAAERQAIFAILKKYHLYTRVF